MDTPQDKFHIDRYCAIEHKGKRDRWIPGKISFILTGILQLTQREKGNHPL